MKKQQQAFLLATGILVAGIATQALGQEEKEHEYRIHVERVHSDLQGEHSVKIKVENENGGYRVTGTRELENGETETFNKVYDEEGAWHQDEEFKEFSGFEKNQFIHIDGGDSDEKVAMVIRVMDELEEREVVIEELLQLEKELHGQLNELEEIHNGKVNIDVEKKGEGYEVQGTRTDAEGEETTFSKFYTEEGAWKEDPEFQEFSGMSEIQVLRLKELSESQHALEHELRILREKAASEDVEVEEVYEQATTIFISTDEGEDPNVFVRVGTDGEEVELVEVIAETIVFESEKGFHFVFRTGDEEEEIVLTDDIIEKADLQNGKPFGADAFTVFPNPNNGTFSVELSNEISEPLQIRIVDLQGREVFEKTYDKNGGVLQAQINLNGQESGIYLLQAMQGDRVSTRKIVIE